MVRLRRTKIGFVLLLLSHHSLVDLKVNSSEILNNGRVLFSSSSSPSSSSVWVCSNFGLYLTCMHTKYCLAIWNSTENCSAPLFSLSCFLFCFCLKANKELQSIYVQTIWKENEWKNPKEKKKKKKTKQNKTVELPNSLAIFEPPLPVCVCVRPIFDNEVQLRKNNAHTHTLIHSLSRASMHDLSDAIV